MGGGNSMLEEVNGLVLFQRKHRERDFLVKIFTDKYGAKMFFVRGNKRERSKFAQAIQPFSHGTYIADIRENGLSFLRDAKDIVSYPNFHIDIILNAYGTYLLQLMDVAIDDRQPEPALLDEVIKGLDAIDEGKDAEIIVNLFEVKFLKAFGVMPEWRGCVICGNIDGPFDYSSQYNGLLCQNHWANDLRRYHASPKAIHILRLFSVLSIDKIGEIKVADETKRSMRQTLDKLYEENTGISLKSKKFIDNMHAWNLSLIEKRKPKDADKLKTND